MLLNGCFDIGPYRYEGSRLGLTIAALAQGEANTVIRRPIWVAEDL